MKAVVCRSGPASVSVDGEIVGRIDRGLVVFVAVYASDAAADVDWIARKLAALRVFEDEDERMNRSVVDIGGGLLLIPNFTVAGRTRKGTRPSYTDAAPPDVGRALFNDLAARCAELVGPGCPVAPGRFGADMTIDAQYRGPVTVIIESPHSR